MKNVLATAFLILLAPSMANAQASPPGLVNFQGVLRNASGAPLSGPQDVVFRFFDAPAGGNEILVDSHTAAGGNAITVTGGLFNVQLGSGTVSDGSGAGTYATLTEVFAAHAQVWLEATVGADPAMTPRIAVVSAAGALNADRLDGMDSSAFLAAGGTAANADTLDTLDSAAFLRSDVADAADGVITFNAATTDVRGSIVDGDTGDTDVNIGEDLYVQGGNLGVGDTPNSNYAIYGLVNTNSVQNMFASYNLAINFSTSASSLTGVFSRANAAGSANGLTVYGMRSEAWGAADSTGDRYGIRAETLDGGAGGNHYGVYGLGIGGATGYGGYFDGSTYGVYGTVEETTSSILFGGRFLSTNWDTGGGSVYGIDSYALAGGASNSKLVYGLSASADGIGTSTGNHYGVYGAATSAEAGGTHYGVFGIAGGGATNWGLYTPNNAYVGGLLDFGAGANDDLTAADVTDLTDGGATTLHSHAFDTAAGDSRYLRKDVDDTAAGNITFSQRIGVGTAPNANYGLVSFASLYGAYLQGTQYGSYGYVNENSTANVYAMYGDARNYDTGAGLITGGHGAGYAGGASNPRTVYGLVGSASGINTSTGAWYGLLAVATNPSASGTHTGVRAEGNGGSSNIGGFFRAGGSPTGSSANTNYGMFAASQSAAASGSVYGGSVNANASAASNAMTVYGLDASASAVGTATGDFYGVRGQATGGSSTGYHYGVYGTASGGNVNWGGFFSGGGGARMEGTDASGVGGVWGGYGAANATAAGNTQWPMGLFGDASGSATSTGSHFGVYGNANSASPSATHYGVYGTASGGATNWGLYTPDNAGVLGDLTVSGGNINVADGTLVAVAGNPATMTIAGVNLDLYLGDSTSDQVYFYGSAVPQTANVQDLGNSILYFDNVYANDYFGKSTSIVAFDIYPDLDLLDAMVMTPYTDPQTGRTTRIFTNLPPQILGDPSVDGPGADQFVDTMKAVGFTFGSLRQMRLETRGRDAALREELNLRTPDPATGTQNLDGNLQIVLDRQAANESARFSVFRDGQGGLQEEIFRLDEEGNLRLKGALMPNALDLAEYHPVTGPFEPGDVLVADRVAPGNMRRSEGAADKAVVGIVSAGPGVSLGAGIQRLTALEPEISARIDEARQGGDKELEAALWSELETRFRQTHAAIALSGTVLCKVDASFGSIEVGDLLVTSPTAGHAMRSDDPAPGTVIAKALEPLVAGTGTIKVLVMLR